MLSIGEIDRRFLEGSQEEEEFVKKDSSDARSTIAKVNSFRTRNRTCDQGNCATAGERYSGSHRPTVGKGELHEQLPCCGRRRWLQSANSRFISVDCREFHETEVMGAQFSDGNCRDSIQRKGSR